MALAVTGWKCLPLSGLTADIPVSQIFSSLFIPLAWLRIWIMFVYYVVFLFPNGIFLIHENTRLVLFINSCTKCLRGKNKQKTVKWKQNKNASLHYIPHLPEIHQTLLPMRAPAFWFLFWIWQFSLRLHFPTVLRCTVSLFSFLLGSFIYMRSQE